MSYELPSIFTETLEKHMTKNLLNVPLRSTECPLETPNGFTESPNEIPDGFTECPNEIPAGSTEYPDEIPERLVIVQLLSESIQNHSFGVKTNRDPRSKPYPLLCVCGLSAAITMFCNRAEKTLACYCDVERFVDRSEISVHAMRLAIAMCLLKVIIYVMKNPQYLIPKWNK